MIGTEELRGHEYAALMSQARGLSRTALLCWTGASVAAAMLLSTAVSAKNAGLMLPVEMCAAFGFYATVHARRQVHLIEGYVREAHEAEHGGAQWFTRLAQLATLPGYQDHSQWLPLAVANALTLVSVVFSWLYATGAAHGELMAGVATMAGVAFSVHSLVESMQLDQVRRTDLWGQSGPVLREVTKRAASTR